jgi:hypothetical protein
VITEACTEKAARRRILDQRVAGSSARGFAGAIDEPGAENELPRSCRSKERPGDRSQPVPGDDPRLSPLSGPVREPPGDASKADRDSFGDALDDADDGEGRAEDGAQEERNDRVCQLAREVVRERDPAEGANVLRQSPARRAESPEGDQE